MGGSRVEVGSEIGRRRLRNQRVVGEPAGSPEEVVGWLGAVQAQDYAQALWAVGVRLGSSARSADVERALEKGGIVRTWPMRGTIHFVPSRDVRWMLRLCASRMLAADDRRLGQLGLDREVMDRCAAIFRDALRGGRRLTRSGMMEVLEASGIGTGGQRAYHVLWYLSQAGEICPGPMLGKEQTFVLLGEWVPDTRELNRDEALAELAARYFASHGPATVHDFARWSGLTVTDSRRAVQASPGLVPEEIGGTEYWTGHDEGGEPPEGGVHLLPAFDEFVIGYKDRGAVLDPEHAHKIIPGNNGVFQPTIVLDGRIAGTWKRKANKRSVKVTLRPFSPLEAAEKEAATEAAKRYADFIGLPLSSVETETG